ncbi:MAG: hypothetical protein HC797_05590 [Anaerolineales bacterium]|nr:hypothetical protein [Anaerolineales bacterium]
MKKQTTKILISLAGIFLLAVMIYQIPAVNSRLAWRLDVFQIYIKNTINPIGPAPTALPVTPQLHTSTPRPQIQQ